MISSVAELRRRSKALPKTKPAWKKGHGHWWSAATLIYYSFLNPGETITSKKYAQQLSEMHQKLRRLQLALVKRKDPVLLHNAWPCIAQPTLQKFNELGYGVLLHLPYSLDLLPSDHHFFKALFSGNFFCCLFFSRQLFFQVKHFHNQQEAENGFQEFIESQSMDFYAIGKNSFFLFAKVCWL